MLRCILCGTAIRELIDYLTTKTKMTAMISLTVVPEAFGPLFFF